MSEERKDKNAEEGSSGAENATESVSDKESSTAVDAQTSSEDMTQNSDESDAKSDSPEEETASIAESAVAESSASVDAESNSSDTAQQGQKDDSTVEVNESADTQESLTQDDSSADSQSISSESPKDDSAMEGTESSDNPESFTQDRSDTDSQTMATDGSNADSEEDMNKDGLSDIGKDRDEQIGETVVSDSVDAKETNGALEQGDSPVVQKQEESEGESNAMSSDQVEEQSTRSQTHPTQSRIEVPNRRTFSGKSEEVEKKWILIDAEGLVVGRLASFVAYRLRGKHKPEFTPHVDDGDNVIVINAGKVALTGQKYDKKKYYWHTGYPGGIKERTAKAIMEGKFPERVVEKAVKRMLPKGPLANRQYKNLRVYAGPEHPHEAQKPEVIDFGNRNQKNKVSA